MTNTKTLGTLLLACLLGWSSAYAAGDATRPSADDGQLITQLKLGNSPCELINGQLRCALGK